MRLLLDLGNTRLKWAALQGDRWLAHGAVAWNELTARVLVEAWGALPQAAKILGASVVDEAREAWVAERAQTMFSLPIEWVRSPAEAGGIRSAYAEPQRLGVDRFLAMLAAFTEGMAPCVLVGVGTALTLDALAADGRHLGGLIAPGPQLMQQALFDATARLAPAPSGTLVALADNTADAVNSGCWGACAGLVERFHGQVAPLLGASSRLLLSGGDAAALRELLPMPSSLVTDGVLRGLAAWDRTSSPAGTGD